MKNEYKFDFFAENVKKNKAMLLNGLEIIDNIIKPNIIDEIILDDFEKKSFEVEIKIEKIENRDKLFDEALKDENLLVFSNNSKEGLTSFSATITQTFFLQPTIDLTDFSLSIPSIYIRDNVHKYQICKELALCFKPFILYFDDIIQNYNIHYHSQVNLGLPVLVDLMSLGVDIYLTPISLSWINYWDKNTVMKANMVYEKDKLLFAKSEQLNDGGILFQITETPPDVNIPEHLEKIKEIYKRYPFIGGQHLTKS